MSKTYSDKDASTIFIKKYFKNCKNYKEHKLVFFYRMLIKIIPDVENIPETAFIDVFKFDQEIKNLSSIDQKILSLRYGENDDVCHPFSEMSDIIFIPSVSLAEIEMTIRKKLRRYLNTYYFTSTKPKVNFDTKTPISELNLIPGIRNTLYRANICTIEELSKFSKENLMLIYGIGKKGCNEIIIKLEEYKKNKA